jgi:hypothetical protein
VHTCWPLLSNHSFIHVTPVAHLSNASPFQTPHTVQACSMHMRNAVWRTPQPQLARMWGAAVMHPCACCLHKAERMCCVHQPLLC